MRRRIYYLIPDLSSAKRTMNDLLLARIGERHIHFLAKDEIDLSSLHRANILQESDIVHGAEMGLLTGGGIGVLAGFGAAYFVFADTGLPWGGVVLATFIIGALFGTWAASMIGVSAPNSRLRQFEKAIDAGQIMLMADVPVGRVAEIEEMLRSAHPELHLEGTEPSIPAFP